MTPGLDVASLERHLQRELPDLLGGPLHAEPVAGGRSNLTYLLGDGRQRWVLRRPPLGVLAASAHDVAREHRLLTALHPTDVPVPRPVLLVGAEVLGAPCYVMEHVAGDVLREGAQLESLGAAEAGVLVESLADVLARLHRVDVAAVGLGDLGRGEGYLERQLRRFAGQLAASPGRPPAPLELLGRQLAERLPPPRATTLVHGDYRLDNVVVDPATRRVRAVLDWEMATLGDPLIDLASTVLWWDGMCGLDSPVAAVPGDVPGLPGRDALVAAYARSSGADVAALPWYEAFSAYKVAAIFVGIRDRAAAAGPVDEAVARLSAMVLPLVERGSAVLDAG